MFECALLTLARVGRQWRQCRELLVNRRFELVVKILKTFRFHMGQGFLRRAIKDQLAAHQHHDLVEQLDVLHRVGRENDGASALRDLPEELHDLFFRRRIETGSGFVQKNH